MDEGAELPLPFGLNVQPGHCYAGRDAGKLVRSNLELLSFRRRKKNLNFAIVRSESCDTNGIIRFS